MTTVFRRSLFASTAVGLLAGPALAQELTVWAWDPNFNGAAMEAAAAAYQEAGHPDFVLDYQEFAREEIEQKLQTQLAAGTMDGLPDIVLIEDYSAQKFLLSFPGAFQPLTDVIDYSGFADYKVALATVDGETYSMPFDSGVTGLFYRSDLIEQAGFTAEDMQDLTWDRFIEIGEAVTEATGTPMISLDIDDPGLFVVMLQSTGSWFFNEDGSLNIEGNEDFRAALADYQQILQSDMWKPVNSWAEYQASLAGDVASTVTGVWITGTIKAAEMPGQWAVAPIPRVEEAANGTNYSNLGGSSWYVLNSSDDKELVYDFLNTVWGSDVDFYQDILVGQGAVGSLLAAREGDAYQTSDDYFGGQPVWQDFSSWLGQVPAVDYGIFTYEVRSAIASNLPALADGGDLDEAIGNIAAEAAVLTQ
ncbi:ABC transporter substrate-binding protein [Wenxinia marina]|uniref:Lactose-binding protein n=1 Tax=Wenxinia marina DSM 24838 TaxID=1123501 RepID=A0A0D0NL86_9RHOB|nr:ABC transporter substrate-binding protein [Wenxinia marina]KIQ69070.1 lactose-binding protein [Wenxinia marina DSM 24838]GGL70094.1 ABC transporter substrate-binding protein [Wenxinia marina]